MSTTGGAAKTDKVESIDCAVALACCAGVYELDAAAFEKKVDATLAFCGLGTDLPGWSDSFLPEAPVSPPKISVELRKLCPEIADYGKILSPGHVVRFCVAVVKSTLHVAFRGSANVLDIVSDIGIMPTPLGLPDDASGTMVPSGMLAPVLLAEPLVCAAVESALQERTDIKTVVFSGHSLGGALATIFALRWQSISNPNSLSVKVCTFGAPQTRLCPEAYAVFRKVRDAAAAAAAPHGSSGSARGASAPAAAGSSGSLSAPVTATATPSSAATTAAASPWESGPDVHNFILYGDLVPRLMLMGATAFGNVLRGLVDDVVGGLPTIVPGLQTHVVAPYLHAKLEEVEEKTDLRALTFLRNSYVIHGECTMYFTRHRDTGLESEAPCFCKAERMELKHLNTQPQGSVMDCFADHKLDNYIRALSIDLLLSRLPDLRAFFGIFRIRINDKFVEHKHGQMYLVGKSEKDNNDRQLFKAVVHNERGIFSIGCVDGSYWRVPDPGMNLRAVKKSVSTSFRKAFSLVGIGSAKRNSNLGIGRVEQVSAASKFSFAEGRIRCEDKLRPGHEIRLATEAAIAANTREESKLYCTDSHQCKPVHVEFVPV